MKLRTATFEETNAIGEAIMHLRQAIACLKKGKAKRTLLRARATLKSADGAHRHALRARFRAMDADDPVEVARGTVAFTTDESKWPLGATVSIKQGPL